MRRRAACLGLLALAGCGGGGSPSASTTPRAASVRVEAHVTPIPVPAEGRLQLVYELRIDNVGGVVFTPRRLEVAWPGGSLEAEGAALNRLFERTRFEPGATGLVYLWLEVDVDGRPDSLAHRLSFDAGDGSTVTAETVVPVSDALPLSLGPPLAGADWLGLGISNDAGHRRVAPTFGAGRRLAQRFAIDWVRLGPDGETFAGDPTDNRSYHAWGIPLLAVADGVVAAALDGVAENVPGRVPPVGTVPLAGNHVLLQVDPERSVLYAHLVPGSLRVGVGDEVRKGNVIGLLGNSGNSTQPHLHLHAARVFDLSSDSTLDADGLPFVLDRFVIQAGRAVAGVREHELPLEGAVISFD